MEQFGLPVPFEVSQHQERGGGQTGILGDRRFLYNFSRGRWWTNANEDRNGQGYLTEDMLRVERVVMIGIARIWRWCLFEVM